MADIRTNIGGLSLKNPVMTASGTFGYGIEFADLVNLEDIGGIIVKGTTLNPREGNDYPQRHPAACSTASDCKTKVLTISANTSIQR